MKRSYSDFLGNWCIEQQIEDFLTQQTGQFFHRFNIPSRADVKKTLKPTTGVIQMSIMCNMI